MKIIKSVLFLLFILIVGIIVGCSKEEVSKEESKKDTVIEGNSDESSGIQVVSSGKSVLIAGRDWNLSEQFTYKDMDLAGKPEVLGLTLNDKTTPFYINKPQKHIWFFWGNADQFNDALNVVAIHKDSKEQVQIVKNAPLGGPLYGTSNHAPTLLKFTKGGIWALDAYIGDQLFGSITIQVHE